MKTKMLTTLAHDIRSPLSVILMRAELGERRSENEKMEQHFNRIKSNTNKIEGLIKDLLDWTFTKNSSTFHVEESNNSISKTIKSSIEYISDSADLKNIKIVSQLDDTLIPHDPTMVETIFRNLLSNSVKFSKENTTVRIESFHKNAYHVKIFDTGATLTKEQVQKIQSGDPQDSSVGTSGEKGYGLGLSLVKTFLNMHNASIYINENPEGGNVFELVFPL
jgi:signal transduction histidine kinase